jgi:23S rRNA pseudouridine1911/1915/1917 synthase
LPTGKPERRPRFSRELAVLYEDDAIVVVNKPPGLTSVPIPGANTPSVQSLLSPALRSRQRQALVVHRIDRFTSGALLFAKTEPDRENLIRQFLAHTPVREYLAVLRGKVEVREATLVHYLRRRGMFQKLSTEQNPEATRAEMRYVVERDLRNASLVRVTLVTGLQNQIRVQFAAIGHPVVGDRKYQPGEEKERHIDRVALHAARLGFLHPRTGKKFSIDCPPPRDFQELVKSMAPERPREKRNEKPPAME